MDRIAELETRLTAIEKHLAVAPAQPSPTVAAGLAPVQNSPAASPAVQQQPPPAAPSFAEGATLNVYLDGYYGWNSNRPVGRVNLLRSNDVLANNLTLNQTSLILERAAEPIAGRRFGARVDLMFGQNTETLQGGAQNEPRPQVYRNIFQAYGSYIIPVGSGLEVDFGKFSSSLGVENNYGYHEINYSRSFYFNFLPFYHMGVRSTYNLSDKVSFQHWLVNGANQTEDFNGGKSNAFLLTVKPAKTVSWNLNYYVGQENRDLRPVLNPELPALPTQPGLSITPVSGPKPDGRTHIFDTYASWNASANLLLAGEFDYVVARVQASSAPSHVIGTAGYLKYQFTPQLALGGRFEYLSDRGGLFSGLTQALKEHTITGTYQPVDGFQLRFEYRHDFSNRPFFLSSDPAVLKQSQSTATLGAIWWFGGKREPW